MPEIAHAWGIVSHGLTLLRNGLKHVFAGTPVSGAAVIIRITDDAHRAASLIQAEVDWLSLLRQHGCTVTKPLPNSDGDLLKTLSAGGRTLHVVCFERFTGSPVTPGDPLTLGLGQQGFKRVPLGISDIGRIKLSAVHSPYNVPTVGAADHFSDSFYGVNHENGHVLW